jgi:hypothetical protein
VIPRAACAASCRKLQATHDGVAKADPFADPGDGAPPRILANGLRPGAVFRRNQVLARFVVAAATPAEAERLADRVQHLAATASGFPACLPEPLAHALAYPGAG